MGHADLAIAFPPPRFGANRPQLMETRNTFDYLGLWGGERGYTLTSSEHPTNKKTYIKEEKQKYI